MKTTDSLHSALTSLRAVLAESAAQGAVTEQAVRQQAAKADYPYPELAAQVFKFLQAKPETKLDKGASADAISDAFVALLLDADAVEALGAGKAHNPWLQVRTVLRRTGFNLGASLIDVYQTVRQTGLGYAPTLVELAAKLAGLARALGAKADTASLTAAAQAAGLAPWQIALAALWSRRRKKLEDLPTDADLEEIFADEALVEELTETDGPWEVYTAQAQTLRTLRHFGQSLIERAEAEPSSR